MTAARAKKLAASETSQGDANTAHDSRHGVRAADTGRPLDPKLRPFIEALADLLLADLFKYPPKP